MNDRWWGRAACLDIRRGKHKLSTEERVKVFYPNMEGKVYGEQLQTARRALKICSGCAVREICLQTALDEEYNESTAYGIRGGMIAADRLAEIDRRRSLDMV